MSTHAKKRSFAASFPSPPRQPPTTTSKSVDSMASSRNGGSISGANAPNAQQHDNGSESDAIPVTTTANAGQNQTAVATPPTSATTNPPPAPMATAPARETHQRGLRGSPWLEDEDMFVFTLLAEEPTMPWREITPRLNSHFRDRPARTSQAVRLRFRQWRAPFQARLNAQRGVGDHLAVEESEGEDDGEEDDEEEIQGLAQILVNVIDGVKLRKEDSDDEGPGGDDLPGGGAPIAV